MRITNAMMTNTTLLHINRNMRNLDEIIRQIETTKRIGQASDNPIVASRALKFRTGVVENEVFQGNVRSAQAWMNVTDAALSNINSEIMLRFRELLVGAATGTYNTPLGDKQAIITQIESLFHELTTNINQTMAGRYVFSGLRTDEPPVFRQGNDRSFVITQNFTVADIIRTNTFQRVPRDLDYLMDTRVHQNVSIINLAYTRLNTFPELGEPQPQPQPVPSPSPWRTHVDNPQGIHVPGFHIRKVSIDDPQAYIPVETTADFVPPILPPQRVLHLVAETGELVMHNDTAARFPSEGISVTYKKTGFRPGELNPAVYFDAREIIDATAPADTHERVYRLTQQINRNNATNYVPGGPVPANFTFTIVPTPSFDVNAVETGLRPDLPEGVTLVGNVLTVPSHLFNTNTNVSISFCVTNPAPNNPPSPNAPLPTHIKQNLHFTNVELVRALDAAGIPIPLDQADPNRSFNMHNQDMEFEFATRTHVPINTLAKNVLTDKMFADFRRLFEFSHALRISTPEALRLHYHERYTNPPYEFSGNELESAISRAVENQISKEETDATGALFHVINNMLLVFDRHASQSLREHTIVGSRMVRMELLESRLEQDEVTLRDLQSSNEDTDMIRAIILRMSAEAAFMASLQANSGIVQMSLANFIRL